jgi:hypothetical protein
MACGLSIVVGRQFLPAWYVTTRVAPKRDESWRGCVERYEERSARLAPARRGMDNHAHE